MRLENRVMGAPRLASLSFLGDETNERRWDLHISGVHVECRPKGRYGGHSPSSCRHAGGVERFHAHSYEGPLLCGCDDFGT